jgi:ABC-type lipopolysaccharide export system ATPase subunit
MFLEISSRRFLLDMLLVQPVALLLSRDVTYQVTPRAVKDYDGVVATLLSENVDMVETVIDVDDGTKIPEKSYIYIGQEEMYVENVTGNRLLVKRAQDKSPLQNHFLGRRYIQYTASR